jgi:hypothetical protein
LKTTSEPAYVPSVAVVAVAPKRVRNMKPCVSCNRVHYRTTPCSRSATFEHSNVHVSWSSSSESLSSSSNVPVCNGQLEQKSANYVSNLYESDHENDDEVKNDDNVEVYEII